MTSGHDKTLRLWERSEEVLVLDDERETEREREGDEELATGDARVVAGQKVGHSAWEKKSCALVEQNIHREDNILSLKNAFK